MAKVKAKGVYSQSKEDKHEKLIV